jgi:lysyl endopeptidase
LNSAPRFSPIVRLILILLLAGGLIVGGKAISQASASAYDQQAQPVSSTPQPLDAVETVEMPSVDVPALLAEDETRRAEGLPPRFAQPIPENITPWNQGTWDTLPNGSSIWRLRVQSVGALSLNFGFSQYHMPEGGSLTIYKPDHSRLIGPFSAMDNEGDGQLWSPILLGDQAVIEVVLPTARVADLELRLTSINHGYVAFGQPDVGTSGACNLDVACPVGDAWADEARSVAMLSINGSIVCTGFLVNDTAQDLKGYLMTVNHCGINSGNASTLVAYWNFQNSWCRPLNKPINSEPGDGQLSQYNTGAIFRASYVNSDFTLVELDDPINPAYNVYWAGWDHSGPDATSATTIHYPNAEEKRISFENGPTSVTSYFGTDVPGDGTHIRITDWDLGTTAEGSSGAPLFDQNHHVIGQLHGGFAACGFDLSDWYGRISTSWTGGGSASSRLSDWLDPIHTGKLTLEGRNRVETPFTLVTDPNEVSVCAPQAAVYGITVTQKTPGFFNPVALSIFGVPGGAQAEFSVNPVMPTFNSALTLSQTGSATPGSYTMELKGVQATNVYTTPVLLDLFNAVPDVSVPLTPTNSAVEQPLQPALTWQGAPLGSEYSIRLDRSPLFTQPLIAEKLKDPIFTPFSPLEGGRCYWWSVQTQNACGEGSWTEPIHFATANLGKNFEDEMESGNGKWTHAAAEGADHWAITDDQSHSPNHAWFVPDEGMISDSRLWTTNPIMVSEGSQLSFWQYYQFERPNYDGAVLEISNDGGAGWNDLGEFITANGYNGTVDSGFSNPLAGRQAWVGKLAVWTEVKVDLSSFAGQEVLIRWRIGSDSYNADVGWYIDDVLMTSPLPPNLAASLLSVTPDHGVFNSNTRIRISGDNFITTPSIMLGDTWLIAVAQESKTTLDAVVPAGVHIGTYDLTLYNGDCQVSVLPGAFKVGLGVYLPVMRK